MNQDNINRGLAPEPALPVLNDNDRFFQAENPVPVENPVNPEVPVILENQVTAPVVEAQNPVLEPVTAVPASPAEAVSSETVSKIPDQPAICTDPKQIQAANIIFSKEPAHLGGLYEMSDGLYSKE